MGKQYKYLTLEDIAFIQEQKLFYLASCAAHEVNLSPKGYASMYVADPSTLYMLDYLGSGNRTARDIGENGEITVMFNAFEGEAKILRCFCKGELIEKEQEAFRPALSFFKEDPQAIRQIFKLSIYAVETSCGMGVPLMCYQKERPQVRDFALMMAKEGRFDDYANAHKIPPKLV